jgi:DNA-binding beta-propeller fold protein YncE
VPLAFNTHIQRSIPRRVSWASRFCSGSITISSNSTTPNTLITCTVEYIPVCGDYNPHLWMHPSGKYIFVEDDSVAEASILYINTTTKRLVPSGASIPGGANFVAFSPDGLLVYAAAFDEILIYVFNPHTGLLTARTSIAAPIGVGHLLPWQ